MKREKQEYPKMVYRPVSHEATECKIIASAHEADGWFESPAQALEAWDGEVPADTPVLAMAQDGEIAALRQENEALKAENAQFRKALDEAKRDYLALHEAYEKATEQSELQQERDDTGVDIPADWKSLHHKQIIAIANRLVDGVATKDDAIYVIEEELKRRNGDSE